MWIVQILLRTSCVVNQKSMTLTLVHIFALHKLIFKILSSRDLMDNLQQN